MTTRTVLPVVASLLLLAGCGGSSSPSTSAAGTAPSATASAAATASAPARGGSAAAGTTGGAPVGTTGTSTSVGATRGRTATTTGAAAGTSARTSPFTAPGTYTYDTSGTVTAGTPHDASGTATLTVDPPVGGRQHSLLGTDRGRTEQDVVVRNTGVYLARLAMTNPTFSKEFRFAQPVLLVAEPPTTGRTWSWTGTSTDGKTKVAVTARITGRETLTIGGVPTPTTVIQSTLQLTGDITYTAHMQNWYDGAHHLSVKDHTKGEGTESGLQFSTDTTNVIRSTEPS